MKSRLLILLIPAAMTGAATWSWFSHGIVFDLFGRDINAAARIDLLKDYFRQFGAFAPLVYFVFVTIEVVVAPIPGLMLYAPGGIIFGPVTGGAIALAGNVAGAGIACSVARTFGHGLLARWFEPAGLERVQRAVEKRGGWLILLLRLNPLTSSDIVSWAAGLTRIPVWRVMFATAFGMAPLCFAQAWLADGLLTAFPKLIYPLLIACGVYAAIVVVVLRNVVRPGVVAPEQD
ncbi:MAG: VTT domain-containing protein [Planctomycetaceae bacterium]